MSVTPLFKNKGFAFPLQNALEHFYMHCEARNLSPRTLKWYKERFKPLARFLMEHYPDLPLESVTSAHLREFLVYLKHDCGSCEYTIKKSYDALNTLYGFLHKEKILPENPMKAVSSPQVTRKLVAPLDKDEIQRLLAQPNQKIFCGFRDYVLIALFLDTGLRLNEALTLTVHDVNLREGTLLVMGKMRKQRKVPFGQTIKTSLMRYIAWRGEVQGQDFLFLNQFGEKLQVRIFQRTLLRHAKNAGIQKHIHPHLLRHTFALNFILQGGNPFILQEILGHTTLEMTRRYVSLANQSFTGNRVSFMDRLAENGHASLPRRKMF